jgi:hypothetical protein
LTSPDWGDFGEWVTREMREIISRGEKVPDREYHLAIGPYPKVKFHSRIWAQGKFMRTASRDIGKATQDSGIAARFIQGGRSIEYYGKIESIVQIRFTSFEVTLLKGMWFNSEPKHDRALASLVLDECGFNRIKVTNNMMKSTTVSDEPFVYPGDVEQVFFVEDKLHKGWELVVPYDRRTKYVYYER